MFTFASWYLSTLLTRAGASPPLTFLPYAAATALFALFFYFLWKQSTRNSTLRF